uniref:SCP domain-containing protein n=1 Tax=Chromera velia CCMP2878 TaxID=1169474 RepID=A0A0G4GU47_9ALVE|eukprot:Cvel_23373.t1-p1 / transcript=Cvel_23373.t1 / gene=Cvel_23373 / organism=Chromera_velia_CCMP2878 / gene_product=Pathogenesis-related protein PR-1 type, putative / transcript_product=Pathogenesis-related protein PR-1 type, putative / location=Cvel_scaffold2401:11814-13500(-) / protein_length=377 / sequence_SO=supercontig / SO=protein_coding / is_pseudo=false
MPLAGLTGFLFVLCLLVSHEGAAESPVPSPVGRDAKGKDEGLQSRLAGVSIQKNSSPTPSPLNTPQGRDGIPSSSPLLRGSSSSSSSSSSPASGETSLLLRSASKESSISLHNGRGLMDRNVTFTQKEKGGKSGDTKGPEILNEQDEEQGGENGMEGLSSFETGALDRHNGLRNEAAIGSLSWDSDLAEFASDYLQALDLINFCNVKPSDPRDRNEVGRFHKVGENLYSAWGQGAEPGGADVVDAWHAEVACYRYAPFGSSCSAHPSEECNRRTGMGLSQSSVRVGHFTQMMWNNATHVGCAVHRCVPTEELHGVGGYRGEGEKYLASCVYGSEGGGHGGNVEGEMPFASASAKRLGLLECAETTKTEEQSLDEKHS